MRRVAACVVLAAAIATPGIVVAATSGPSASVSYAGSGTARGTYVESSPPKARITYRIRILGHDERPLIDPRLRPAARALEAAFAHRGVTLIPLPAGKGTAVLFAKTLQTKPCATTIVLQTLHAPSFQTPPCPSKGVGVAHGLRFRYTPASISPIVLRALGTLH